MVETDYVESGIGRQAPLVVLGQMTAYGVTVGRKAAEWSAWNRRAQITTASIGRSSALVIR
jgi:hypothetical protein